MASSYTTDLRLELQANGENNSTWGEKLNTVIELLEDAITGYTSVATTGGSTTLTTNNSASDQARSAMLKITGTLTSNATITIPAVAKQYMVWNATSGSYTVTIKTSGGTGYAVGQGVKVAIFCDGTDTYSTNSVLSGISSTVATLGENTFTLTQTIDSATAAQYGLYASDSYDSTILMKEDSNEVARIFHQGSSNILKIRKLQSDHASIACEIQMDESGNVNVATGAFKIASDTAASLSAVQTLTNKTLTSPVLNTGVSGTAVLDEDAMTSDSNTKLATQQSIKAYVDSRSTAALTLTNKTLTSPVLNTGVSGTAVLDEDAMTSNSATKLATQQSIKAYVDSRATAALTLTNKTLTSPVLNTGVSGTAVLDEDDMASNSATKLATQQSIKAYVDAQTGGSSLIQYARRTSNSLRSTTTLTNDSELIFSSIDASSYYHVEAYLLIDSTTGAEDYNGRIYCDGTGATANIELFGINAAGTHISSIQGDITTDLTYDVGTAVSVMRYSGVVYTGTSPTLITLRWAKQSSSGSNLAIHTDSYLKITKIT